MKHHCLSKGKINKNSLTERIDKNSIVKSLSNTLQVVFEVTERCNLKCKYCGYGEYYTEQLGQRDECDLPVKYAKSLLDYLFELWNSNMNLSYKKKVAISFYGGEPLMNTHFISEVIAFVNKANLKNIDPKFTMTTNAVLLKKNIAFLVKNNFEVLISLDGDKKNNSYRVYKNGNESFDHIIENIDFVQKNYPDFFEKNIQFNSVIHDRSLVSQAFNFIYGKYGKTPRMAELNTVGIAKSKEDEFRKSYVNKFESLNQSKDYRFIRDKLFTDSPDINSITSFLLNSSNNVYKTYLDFFTDPNTRTYLPTGTCVPFSRKIFLTAKGTILQCESISDNYPFGKVDKNGVFIDFDKIIKITNNTFDRLVKYCNNCLRAANCEQCIFNLNLKEEKIKCPGFTAKNKIDAQINFVKETLKKDRKLYKKILNEVHYE